MQRTMTDSDLREMSNDYKFIERRRVDRRKSINSFVDPYYERRKKNRRRDENPRDCRRSND